MVSSSSFEDNASVETLVLAGITFGLAHVLSGPDHLCALAVIASSSSSSDSYDDDDDDENDQDEENCNDLNIERVDVDDDGKKRMRRETKNVKDDEESQSVVVYGDDDYVIIANTTNDTKKRFNDPKLLLAANRKSQQRRDNFLLGISWAFGHSFGLSLLVCVFFALKKELNINAIGDVGDKIVGFTMIAIAFAAARGARKFRDREKAEREHVRDSEAHGEGEEMAHLGDEIILEIDPTARTKVVASGSKEHEEMHLRREPHVHQRSASRERRLAGGGGNKEGFLEVKVVGVEKEERGENDEEKNVSSSGRGGITTTTEKDEEKKDSRKKSAFLVGLVHGISGVSGILGVLPGVVLNSSAKSAAFIVSFLLCSTIAMTLFSVLFGETLRKAASFAGERGKGKSDGRKLASNVIVGANAFFALGSFACGLVWLYLSFSGEGVDV